MPESSAFNIPSSPIATTGTIVLLVAYLVAAYGAATGIVGNAQRRRRMVSSSVYSLYGFFALMTIASALMVYAFVTHDYTIKYVAEYSDTAMPLSYKITAYWGGLDGSLMFWVFMLALFAAIAVWMNRERHRDMIGYVCATVLLVSLFFLSLLVFSKNPFQTYLTQAPPDGEGLNPLLQNYWMVIHPPALYTGFVAATIPFAFGIGALASGRLDDRWLHSMRSWTLICWFFLSLGLILGGRWAYEELGWGGYWAWDPVENAGFLPWFTATAFLHSAIIQEQRGMLKVWNLILLISTFFLTIFGTFMTRSGIVQSVHSFGEDNELALLFILFMAVILVVSFGLLIHRLPRLRSSNTFESFISREYAFLLNNWILLACAFFVLFATMFPTLSEAIEGNRITVGPEFFNKWTTPIGLVLLFLAGAAPLLAWRRTTRERLKAQFLFPTIVGAVTLTALVVLWPRTAVRTAIFSDALKLPMALINFGLVAFTVACIVQEFWKGARVRMRQTGSDPATSLIGLVLTKRRKYGGYVIHMAIAVMFVGFGGKAFEAMEDFTVSGTGETFEVRDYTFRYDALEVASDDNKREVTARVTVFGPNGDELSVLEPSRRHYHKQDQPTTEVSIHHRLDEDVYLVLTGFKQQQKVANFRVYVNPLVNWVWIGFGLLILGTAICLVPQSVVDSLSPRRRTRAGRATEAALVLLALGGVTFGLVGAGHAQAPDVNAPAAGEHDAPQHDDGGAYAHLYRPDSSTASALMKDLVCLCGGCQRLTLYACDCGYAAQERNKVLAMLEGRDLPADSVDEEAYDEVVAAFVQEYGGEHVLASPQSKLAWLIPYVAIGGGLILLYGFGRRWVRRGRRRMSDQPLTERYDDALGGDDEEYAEILDDELRDTD